MNALPNLHTWDDGATWNTGGFNREHLEKVIQIITQRFPTARIIETGAGNSTISFLFCGPSKLVSICPEPDLFGRIKEYCASKTLDDSAWEPIEGFSETVLPDLAKDTANLFDFALIDGHHGWPLVFVDFCYLNQMLRQGGLLMIDDIQLHSVRELANLLREQPGFTLAADLGKALIFEKTTSDRGLPEWNGQPYIVRNSAG
ncbi:hypothetical protein K32_39310 [Kaistia sp. 32K]|nr:hypothetical protein K32_39310 [Kaistia sp. 32K]